MMLKQPFKTALLGFALATALAAHGQQGRWASPGDPTARFIVDAERQWAAAACTHNGITGKILAEDFQGTSPAGKRYTKSEAAHLEDSSGTVRECHLLDAKVRFFGESLAMVYGRESAVEKGQDGTAKARCLIWTDTWLKRDGTWQIIAAQDMPSDCK